MSAASAKNRRSSSARRYRRLMGLFFSRQVIVRHGDEMEATFLRFVEIERRRRGDLGVAAAWLGAFADGVRAGWLGRREATNKVAGRTRNRHRTRPGFAFSWLDAKLGVRMLGKHPGLTAVALFALAVGIPVGLAPWHLFTSMEAALPVEEGQRIHLLRHWNTETSRAGATTLYDYERWRAGLDTFEALGGFRRGAFNVGSGAASGAAASGAAASGAEVTASTFAILRVAPLHGRALVAADEVIGAPNVVVESGDLGTALGHFGLEVGAHVENHRDGALQLAVLPPPAAAARLNRRAWPRPVASPFWRSAGNRWPGHPGRPDSAHRGRRDARGFPLSRA